MLVRPRRVAVLLLLLSAGLAFPIRSSLSPDAAAAAEVAPARPNVVLLVTDDHPWSLFSPELMPTVFGEIAGRGALFRRAYVNTPMCCPSRAQIVTGLYGRRTGVDKNNIGLSRPTIVDALDGLGYRTMLAGKYLNSWPCEPRPEFDEWACVGHGETSTYSLVDPYMNVNGTWTQFAGYQTDILADRVRSFISTTPADEPFFVLYSPTSPHIPANDARYSAMPVPPHRPPSFDTQSDETPAYLRRPPMQPFEAGKMAAWHRIMYWATRALDDSIRTILDSVGDRSRDTLVVFVSDNGMLFGEHRRWLKEVPYEESVRVPFAVRYPALLPENSPLDTDAIVESVDIASTVADLLGMPWGGDGRSLVPLLTRERESIREAALIEHCQGVSYPCLPVYLPDYAARSVPSYSGLVTARYKYVEYVTGETELYDLSTDPYELVNLSGDPSVSDVELDLARRLDARTAPVPPETTIVAGPEGPLDNRHRLTFEYFSPSRFSTYECRLDRDGSEGAWQRCNGERVVFDGPLGEGDYTFVVAGTDEHGNRDPTPASRSFSLHSTGPRVQIDSGPADQQEARTVRFTYSSRPPAAEFQCSLVLWGEPSSWESCDPLGVSHGPLEDGDWHFQVRARDLASGEISDPPIQWPFRVDNAGPVFELYSGPPAVNNDREATLAFRPDEPTVGPVTCSLDGAAAVDCSSGSFTVTDPPEGVRTVSVAGVDTLGHEGTTDFSWTVDRTPPALTVTGPPAYTKSTTATIGLVSEPGGRQHCQYDWFRYWVTCHATTMTFTGLSEGPHWVKVRKLDEAFNVSAVVTKSWTIDTTPPVVRVDSGPADPTNQRSATFTFSGSDATPLRFYCRLDGAPGTACKRERSYTGLAEGRHRFSVRAVDNAGNSAEAAWEWTVDLTPPTITMSGGPTGVTNRQYARFRLSSNEEGSVFRCSRDDRPWFACGPNPMTGLLEDGEHTFRALAIDPAGNRSPAASRTWTVDTVAPVATIHSGPADPTTERSATFAFSAVDATSVAFACSLDGETAEPCTTGVTYEDLSPGPHRFAVTGTDEAGNVGSEAVWDWTIRGGETARLGRTRGA